MPATGKHSRHVPAVGRSREIGGKGQMARSWIAEVNIDFAIAALKSRSKRPRKKASFHAVKLRGFFDAP